QFATPITLFPDLRNQDKYQVRYDLSHVAGSHALKFGVDFIHEPVLSGAFASTAETLIQYASNPQFYVQNPSQFYFSLQCLADGGVPPDGSSCTYTPPGDGSFSQNVQRLGLYAEDSWRVSHHLTVNYGLRYQNTWGLMIGSGRNEADNAAYQTLRALDISIVPSVPSDYHKQIAPRLGIAYSPGSHEKTVIRAGFGMYYDDLAQNECENGNLHVQWNPRRLLVQWERLPDGRRGRDRKSDWLKLQDTLCDPHHGRGAARFQ